MTRPLRNERGVALVATLLFLMVIVLLTFEAFRAGMRTARGTAYARDSARALLLAEAGTGAAKIALRIDYEDTKIDTLDEIWSRPAPAQELGDGTAEIVVVDEDRKIDLNRVVLPNGNGLDDQRYAVVRKLLENLALDPSLADALADWLDVDDTPRSGGSETGFYESLPLPYRCKNDLLDTVDELRLIRGFTQEVVDRLRPFVTVHSSTGKVNLNTAPKEVLMALSAGKDAAEGALIDEAMANLLIERRTTDPFERVEQMGEVAPALSDLYKKTRFRDLIDVRSYTFRVRSTGLIGDTSRTVEAVGVRSGNAVNWRVWHVE